MRFLYVTEHWPWPPRSGARLRAAATVQALATLGVVDIAHLDRGWRHSWPEEPARLADSSVTILPGKSPGGKSPADAADYDTAGHDTAEYDTAGYPPQAAATRRSYGPQLRSWIAAQQYELIWLNRVITWTALPQERRAPVIIDVDDLQDRLVLQRMSHEAAGGKEVPEGIREKVTALAAPWRRLQDAAAADAEWLVFSSELDAARFGAANHTVVPNVYLDTAVPEPLSHGDAHPRILLQGMFNYLPNTEAARRLVRDILPRVQRVIPQAGVWLVGMDKMGRLADLASPSVRIFGPVADIKSYVAAADVVAVPLRRGSGTRLKILEALAVGTPVVSTALGAEGLGLTSENQLVIADSDADLAAAIIRVALDGKLREALAGRGREHVLAHHGQQALLSPVGAAVRQAIAQWSARAPESAGG